MNTLSYKNKYTDDIVTIIEPMVSGMCYITLGQTFILYRRERDNELCIEEHIEFYKRFKQNNEKNINNNNN